MKCFFILVLPLFVGCGSVTEPAPLNADLFSPNYVNNLNHGRQWSNPNITVHLRSTAGRDLSSPFSAAKGSWEAQYGSLFTLTPSNSTEASVLVVLVPGGSLGGSTVGLTTITYRSSDARILNAEIELDSSLDETLLTQVLAHELGHALGIDGHSPYGDDVMFPQAHLPLAITERDRKDRKSVV